VVEPVRALLKERVGGFALVFALVVCAVTGTAAAGEPLDEGPRVRGKAAAVVDVNTETLLHSFQGKRRLPMASTTKIMTALLAVEECGLEEVVKIPPVAANVSGSRIFLEAGEAYHMRDLLYALMLSSANDAARAIAVHVGGSLEGFVNMMNERAQQLGLAETSFANPSGLDHSNHYTTAEELALLATYALQNPVFRKFASTVTAEIPYPVKDSIRELRSHNYLLTSYPGATGVKNGYTSRAGFCLVGSAVNEQGREVVAVILGSNFKYVYRDISKLLTWGLVHFQEEQVVQPKQTFSYGALKYGTRELVARPLSPVTVLVKREKSPSFKTQAVWRAGLEAPIEKGTQVGRVEVLTDGEVTAVSPLVAAEGVDRIYVGPPWWLIAVVPLGLVLFRYIRWRARSARLRRQRRQEY
jgi:D-alanyl-D-alanine carboxypeptidase